MTFEEFKDILSDGFEGVSEVQMDRFRKMAPLYREWNEKINVISRKDIDGLYIHHVLHSLAVAKYLKECEPETYAAMQEGMEILDLGTGGGFPGIPLAVMFPNSRFVLCDSVGKKIIVASEVAKALELDNVETVNARAESLGKMFDVVVSRAVTSLDKFYPWVKGRFKREILYLKGGDINGELALMMGQNRVEPSSVHSWNISGWLTDEYFSTKMVVCIEAPGKRA